MSTVDTTLPISSSPAMDHFRDVGAEVLPFALYVHVDLSDRETSQLRQACNSHLDPESQKDTVRLAPHCAFNGQPLRASYDRHISEVALSGEFDPLHFVAVVHQDWNKQGVMLVTLNDGEDELHVDKMIVPVEDSGLVLVNLQIGNIEWSDYQEQYADEDDDSLAGSREDTNEIFAEPAVAKETPESHAYSNGAASVPPSIGYWIGFYAVEGVNDEDLMRLLDNCPIRRPLEEVDVRPEGRVPRGEEDAVMEASILHPRRCLNNVHLCRTMFLVADSIDYREKGLLLVRLDWDATIAGRTPAELSQIGKAAQRQMQRLPVAAAETTTIFDEIVKGYRPWKHDHLTFLVYGGQRASALQLVDGLDKKSHKRHSGREIFLDGDKTRGVQATEAMRAIELEQPWEGAVRRHPVQVYRERFCQTLDRQWFVYSDKKIESRDQLVKLAKTDWDGRVEGKSVAELWDMKISTAFTLECPASKAYDKLVELVSGEA